jgi:hypothetical protein
MQIDVKIADQASQPADSHDDSEDPWIPIEKIEDEIKHHLTPTFCR